MSSRRRSDDAASLAGALEGARVAGPFAAATDATLDGMSQFRDRAIRLTNVGIEFKKGNFFEIIEATKFNAGAAQTGARVRAVVTASVGRPTAPSDIDLMDRSRLVREVQAKASRSDAAMLRAQNKPKYLGMDRLVPADHAAGVRARASSLADQHARTDHPNARVTADTARRVTGEVRHGRARSGGTDLEELYDATRDPEGYARSLERRSILAEVAVAGTEAAVAGALVGGAISLARNGLAVLCREIDGLDGRVILRDAGSAALRAGGVGAGAAVVRQVAASGNGGALARSNVATAFTSAMIDIGVAVYEYANGEISADVAAERIGRVGTSTGAGLFTGASAGLLLGPGWAVVGSVVGFSVAASTFHSCVAILRDARLSAEEARRVTLLCEAARAQVEAVQRALHLRLSEELAGYHAIVEGCFVLIESEDPEQAVAGLSDLARLCGQTLRLTLFEDFDEFMTETVGHLVL